MAGGDAPVQTYIAVMPGWKRAVGRRLDALIARTVPDARKAVKSNSPFHGIEGRGWFLGLHTLGTRAGSTSTRTISTRRRWRRG
jgi:hypothetical protein